MREKIGVLIIADGSNIAPKVEIISYKVTLNCTYKVLTVFACRTFEHPFVVLDFSQSHKGLIYIPTSM